MIVTKPYIGPAAAAEQLNLSVDQVRNLAYAGVLPAIKLCDGSGRLIFPVKCVEAVAETRREQARSREQR